MTSKKAYQQKLQARLDGWNAEIKKIEAKANEAAADSRLEFNRQLKEIRKKKDNAEKKLVKLKDASGDAWEDIKEGIDSAFSSLGDAVDSAKGRFS